MHFFQSSPPRPPRNPARIRPTTGVDDSDGQKSPTVTLSDIVLVRRHKSTGTKIKQPPSKVARPRVNSITLPPLNPARRDTAPTRPDTPSRPISPNLSAKPMPNPRRRPSTAPYPPSSYPRSRPSTPGPSPTSFRPPNPALAQLLATKPPPPPPPLQPQQKHQRAVSLHPHPPPQLRVRTSFTSARPFPNSDSHTSPESCASRSRPTSAYISAASSDPAVRKLTRSFPSPISIPTPKQKSQPPQFSTVDRTILEELRRNISAKAAQFVVKGSTSGGMGKRGGGRHHPFSKEEVPYPRWYEREAVDLDVWETAFCEQICESVTWHVFEEPPTKVLDIGSGTGTWILNCARLWKRCHFVGLDIVPLHPDLQQVGSPDLAARITWVQENFLNGLPFPNEEFDFVHIKRIARGVPEDKWDSLFEEITRVMKPGGAFEMLEEDLFFPGKDRDSDDVIDLEHLNEGITLTNSSASEALRSAGPSARSVGSGLASLGATLLSTPHRSKSTSPGRESFWRLSRPMSRSTSLQDPGRLQQPKHRRQAGLSTTSLSSSEAGQANARESMSSSTSQLGTGASATSVGSMGSETMPLLKTLPRPVANPRDHGLLEVIYREMHAARFINLSPLSLLANTLRVYFKDVRTHRPLQLSFPPRAKNGRDKNEEGESSDSDDPKDYWLLTREDLLERNSRYVCVDETVVASLVKPGLSPPSGRQVEAGSRWARSRLPNGKLRFDVRSLNLHLALRAAETVGCAEAMWEWVVDYQAGQVTNQGSEGKLGRPDDLMKKEAIKTLSRGEFDALLTKFDLDMKDHASMEDRLKEKNWLKGLTASTERKVFDTACEQWEEEEQRRHIDNGEKIKKGNWSPERRLSRVIRVFVAWK